MQRVRRQHARSGFGHSSSKNKFKPDVMVRCGPIIPSNYVTDPIVIIEVLSPSTMDRDRGVKLEFYKELASVQHIVFAYSHFPRIEHYVRTDTARNARYCWLLKTSSSSAPSGSNWISTRSTQTSLLKKPLVSGPRRGARNGRSKAIRLDCLQREFGGWTCATEAKPSSWIWLSAPALRSSNRKP